MIPDSIIQAKKKLSNMLTDIEGFIGVGISLHEGKECLVVYVTEADAPVILKIKKDLKQQFEGYFCTIKVTGEFNPY